MYRVHMGSQVLTIVLVGHESVGRMPSPTKPSADAANRQPILADEVQTFKALITIHKVLQEGHPVVLKEAQANVGWLEGLRRGVVGGGNAGVRGITPVNVRRAGRRLTTRIRIWQAHRGVHLLPEGETCLSPAASRVQRHLRV